MRSDDPSGAARFAAVRRLMARLGILPWDLLLAVAALALLAVAAPVEHVVYGVGGGWALLFASLQSAALLVARRIPALAIVLFSAAGVLLRLVGTATPGAPWPWAVTSIIAFVLLTGTVGAFHGWRWAGVALLAPAATVSSWAFAHPEAGPLASTIVALSLAATGALVGSLLSERLRIARLLEEETRRGDVETERRLVAEERQRIARELHDVVAHGMSLIQVQASTARYRLPELDDAAAAEFDAIGQAARGSLGEMRRILGVLRGDGPAEYAPQRGIGDLPEIVEQARAAGAEIDFEMTGGDELRDAAADLAAFRIAQESLSNAVRHAPGAPVRMRIRASDGEVRILVENAVPPGRRAEAPGHGIVGMHERAALVGGSVEVGESDEGDVFRVRATLPTSGGER
ncbi:sensor histidine kinase [Microbacterium sp. gxy059]|uniref:sensor histidine kinase n=1 Tax=Microbacterium sp. gxy059 TaxID=2957199 RepID=UPI003D970939